MWLGCEQLSLCGKRCVTSRKTVAKGTSSHQASCVVRPVEVRKVYYLSRQFVAMPSFKEIKDLLFLSHGARFFGGIFSYLRGVSCLP